MGKAFAVDVSSAQEGINWQRVKEAGVEYAWIKRSEGSESDEDRLAYFESQRAAAIRAGVKWGAYHFARPRRSNAYRNCLVASSGDYGKPDLRHMLDIEPEGSRLNGWGQDKMTTGELGQWIQQWTVMHQKPCLVYFEHGRSHVKTIAKLAFHGKRPSRMVGLWPSCRPQGVDACGLGHQGVWDMLVGRYRWPWAEAVCAIQFTSSARLDGIDGPVDLNVIDVERCML